MEVAQLQDLAERVPELLAAVGAAELSFEVSVRARGGIEDGARRKVDNILAKVSRGLKLEA